MVQKTPHAFSRTCQAVWLYRVQRSVAAAVGGMTPDLSLVLTALLVSASTCRMDDMQYEHAVPPCRIPSAPVVEEGQYPSWQHSLVARHPPANACFA